MHQYRQFHEKQPPFSGRKLCFSPLGFSSLLAQQVDHFHSYLHLCALVPKTGLNHRHEGLASSKPPAWGSTSSRPFGWSQALTDFFSWFLRLNAHLASRPDSQITIFFLCMTDSVLETHLLIFPRTFLPLKPTRWLRPCFTLANVSKVAACLCKFLSPLCR